MWPPVQSAEVRDRKCTNLSSLIFCAGFVVLMFILVIYSSIYSDIDRLTKGYDDCGNICGENNQKIQFKQCGSTDKQQLPKVLVESQTMEQFNHSIIISHYTCIKECPKSYVEVLNRCLKINSTEEDGNEVDEGSAFQELSHDLIVTWPYIVLNCFISAVFSFILLMLFRYAIKYIIWIIYSSVVILFTALAIFFFVKGEVVFGAVFSVLVVLGILVLYLFRKKIYMVAQLFKEASKALIDLPSILFEPILTFLSLLVAIAPFIFFTIIIETSGNLTEGLAGDGKFQATYEKNFAMSAARLVNFIAFIWFTQFIFGCQHFIIAGTICKWYFNRDKKKLYSPLTRTFSQLISYHLGSVCLGSMIITLVKIVKIIIAVIKTQLKERENAFAMCLIGCLEWIVEQLDRLLQYLIRNAYIIVAKDGTPFIESGKRAFDLLFRNLTDVIALNYFGDFVLILGKLFVVVISGFTGYELMKNTGASSVFLPVTISIIFAFLIAHCFVTVFEMTVDTIFICFCDDCEKNDGNEKPYFMSPSLMKIMREMKESTGGQFNFGNNFNAGGQYVPVQPQDPSMYPITQQPGYPTMPLDQQQPGYPYMPQDQQQGYPTMPMDQKPPYQDQYNPSPYQMPPSQAPYPAASYDTSYPMMAPQQEKVPYPPQQDQQVYPPPQQYPPTMQQDQNIYPTMPQEIQQAYPPQQATPYPSYPPPQQYQQTPYPPANNY